MISPQSGSTFVGSDLKNPRLMRFDDVAGCTVEASGGQTVPVGCTLFLSCKDELVEIHAIFDIICWVIIVTYLFFITYFLFY
jgi:hypothetical protein